MTTIDLSDLQPILIELAGQGRTALLPALHAAQERYGYLPAEVVSAIARALGVPLSEAYGVVEFYALFYTQPVSKSIVHICNDPVCAMAGADGFLKRTRQQIQYQLLDGKPNVSVQIERSPCLGLCEQAPAVLVIEQQPTQLKPNAFFPPENNANPLPPTAIYSTISLLTANCNATIPTRLQAYRANGGYEGLKKALTAPPSALIAEVKASGLVGRGGAAFPTGLKWESAAQAAGTPKYVVCNADEAEPGTFKDRVLIEQDPHRLLEGLLLAAYAIGANKGYIYIRGEYILQHRILMETLTEARKAGLLGPNILGSNFSCEVELRRGAGAYVCGEETALFESIEGKRGLPRVKPPFPTIAGLFGKPTVINNVETLCNLPTIALNGAAAYRQIGTTKSPGPKLFCVSGDVIRPGLYEVPLGFPLRQLFEMTGGMRHGHRLQAILFGGAAGAFGDPNALDVNLSFEDLRAAGLPLGSGVLTFFDETRDLRDVLLRLGRFFAEESCGKCYPCQLGTQRQLEILERIASAKTLPGDAQRIQDIGQTMTDTSLCGLGQTAASATLSALRLWPNLFQPTR
jgi:NADH-quinone oxidoreductase subunit F